MDGQAVFKFAVKVLVDVAREVMARPVSASTVLTG
jgi:3-oxoacyl-[acyl-carrier-protein] synthase III